MPPSSPVFKIIKRVQQACGNCRRKKTRCPGQRPTCSACARLDQECVYGDGGGGGGGGHHPPSTTWHRSAPNRDLEHRMSQLEDMMQAVISRTEASDGHPTANPTHMVTRRSVSRSEQHDTPHLSPETDLTRSRFLHQELFPPPECLSEMVALYRQHCHRQPVWLFSDAELESLSEQPEELLLAMLAITTRFSESAHFRDKNRNDMSQRFGDAARNLVMLKIANAGVGLGTIQSLCLLAWAGFAARDTFLAPLHLNLARDLLRSAGLDLRSHALTPADQPTKRLFWSIYLLEQLYGTQGSRVISLRDGLDNIRYCVTVGEHARRALTLEPPQIPDDASDDGDSLDHGIWSSTLCLSTLWNEVRNYIQLCASDFERAPWAPESYYTLIGSYMHELETQLPQPHRSNGKQFSQCPPAVLEQERSYWAPWVFLQLSYHGIYTVINHPFLLTSRLQSLRLKIPNTFWGRSAEAALVHSTWVCRLITMVQGKGFDLSDPFLGYIVGVAATAQLFYSCSQNEELSRNARESFDKCMAFLDGQAAVWQWCRGIKQNLELLASQAFDGGTTSRVISIDTTLMLDIFDYSRCREADHPAMSASTGDGPGHRLFDGSLSLRGDRIGSQLATMEMSEDPSDAAAGRPVAPPVWRPASASSGGGRGGDGRSGGSDVEMIPDSGATPTHNPIRQSAAEVVHADLELFALPAEAFSDGLLQNIFGSESDWWNVDA